MAPSARMSQALADVEVLALDGTRIRLGSLWSERAALVVFLRHFGCPACSRTVTELAPRVAELRALGVDVACVAPGTVGAARSFLARHGAQGPRELPIRLLVDPDGSAFTAAGMVRSMWAALGPAGLVEQARLVAQGYVLSGPRGDVLWLGGALLLDRGGRIVTAWRSKRISETPRAGELVEAALRLTASRSAWLV